MAKLNHKNAFCSIALIDDENDLESTSVMIERSFQNMVIFLGDALTAMTLQDKWKMTSNLVRPFMVFSKVADCVKSALITLATLPLLIKLLFFSKVWDMLKHVVAALFTQIALPNLSAKRN